MCVYPIIHFDWEPNSGSRGHRDRVPPWHFSPENFCWPTWKRGVRKKGKMERKRMKISKGRRKIWKGRCGNWNGKRKREEKKYENEAEDFFFLLSLFETTKICLGCTKMVNFYWEKAYFTPGKNQEKWLCPFCKILLLYYIIKYFSYATGAQYVGSLTE